MVSTQSADGQRIKDRLERLINDSHELGFTAYAVARTPPRLRKMAFEEGVAGTAGEFRHKLRKMIADVIGETYLSDDVEYSSGTHAADNQDKIYTIPQTGGYAPFAFLAQPETGKFKFDDIDEITGIIFELRRGDETAWAYQHLWSIMVPNKKKSHMLTKVMKIENVDIVAEQKEPLLTIARRVDLLLLCDTIVTSNIRLLQSSFGFREFVRFEAGRAVTRIRDSGIAKNPGKLQQYIDRGGKYAKKMMRISDSAVLELSTQEIISRISTVERWRNSFQVEADQIVLNSYSQVEALIDLLDERYTRSDITSREYDTDVKRLITPA